MEFLDQTKRLFQEMENADGLIPSENAFASLNNETYDLNRLFSSLISSGNSHNGDLNALQGDSFKELMGEACLSTNLIQSSHSLSAIHDESMAPMFRDLAHPSNQLQTGGTEAQVLLSDKLSAQFHQLQPATCIIFIVAIHTLRLYTHVQIVHTATCPPHANTSMTTSSKPPLIGIRSLSILPVPARSKSH